MECHSTAHLFSDHPANPHVFYVTLNAFLKVYCLQITLQMCLQCLLKFVSFTCEKATHTVPLVCLLQWRLSLLHFLLECADDWKEDIERAWFQIGINPDNHVRWVCMYYIGKADTNWGSIVHRWLLLLFVRRTYWQNKLTHREKFVFFTGSDFWYHKRKQNSDGHDAHMSFKSVLSVSSKGSNTLDQDKSLLFLGIIFIFPNCEMTRMKFYGS